MSLKIHFKVFFAKSKKPCYDGNLFVDGFFDRNIVFSKFHLFGLPFLFEFNIVHYEI